MNKDKNMNKHDKQGQVTLFILLGIVILLGVGIFTMTTQETVEEQSQDALREQNEGVRTESRQVEPVRQKIQGCMRSVAQEGMEKAAGQGGISLKNIQRGSLITDSRNPAENNAVDFFGDGTAIVPYWFHSTDSYGCTECIQRMQNPSIVTIASHVAVYVDQNIEECTNLGNSFENLDIDINSDPDTNIFFREEDTQITLDWSLSIENSDGAASIVDSFTTTSNIQFLDLYITSLAVLDGIISGNAQSTTENLASKYTLRILEFLSFDKSIPPVEREVRSGRSGDTWLIQDTKETIKESLAGYTNLMGLSGGLADTPPEPGSGSQVALMSGIQRSANDIRVTEADIDFFYRPSWPLSLQINGKDRGVIRPDITSLGILFIRLSETVHDYVYDVSHPIVVSVSNEEYAPFPFRFAVESNLRGSRPFDESARASTSYTPPGEDSLETPNVETPMGFELTQEGGRQVKIYLEEVTGNVTNEGGIELKCAGQKVNLYDSSPGDRSVYETKIPPCTPATIQYRSSDGFSTRIPVTNEDEYYLDVFTLGNITVKPERLMYNRISRELVPPTSSIDEIRPTTTSPAQIHPDEQIQIVFAGKNGTTYANKIEGIGREISEGESIQLQPGSYEVILISNRLFGEGRQLQSYETEETTKGDINVGPISLSDGETIPSQEFNDSILSGTVSYDLEVTPQDIRDQKEIIVPYMSYDLESSIVVTPDIDILGKITNKSRFPDRLRIRKE